MRYDSHERGLIRSALIRALAGGRGLDVVHQRSQDLVAPANPRDPAWQKLAEIAGRVEGTIRDHPEIRWREGAALRLERADEGLRSEEGRGGKEGGSKGRYRGGPCT